MVNDSRTSGRIPVVTAAQVELWTACATAELAATWRSALPPAELETLAGQRIIERQRRIVQLALRRTVLAARLGSRAHKVEIARTDRGAIALPTGELTLSASHHDDMTVFAIARGATAIGIDIEPHSEDDWQDAVEEVLAASELAALHAVPADDREAMYFTCWTMKEAVMKALGEGLSDRDPKTVEVALPPLPIALLRLDGTQPSEPWALRAFGSDAHVTSVAVRGASAMQIHRYDWPVDLPPVAK